MKVTFLFSKEKYYYCEYLLRQNQITFFYLILNYLFIDLE